MPRFLFILAEGLAIAAVAGCGSGTRAMNSEAEGNSVENSTLAKLNLASAAFQDGQPIPVHYTCDGSDQVPIFAWDDPPDGTKSFALVIDDPDAPNGTFRHWGVFDIPSSDRSIGGTKIVGTQVANDFGKRGYGGPCPPKGHGTHHYHVKLFALDIERLGLGANAKVADVEQAASKHALAQTELIGTFERK